MAWAPKRMTWSAPTTRLIVQAQAARQIEAAWQSTKIASGFGGGMREAPIVLGAEALQYGVGLQQSCGVSQAQFADQPILTSAPGPLDAALGLW